MTAILSATLASLRQRLAEDFAADVRLHRAQLAAIFDRRERLGIERFLMGHAAGQVDMNDALGLGVEEVILLQLAAGFRS